MVTKSTALIKVKAESINQLKKLVQTLVDCAKNNARNDIGESRVWQGAR